LVKTYTDVAKRKSRITTLNGSQIEMKGFINSKVTKKKKKKKGHPFLNALKKKKHTERDLNREGGPIGGWSAFCDAIRKGKTL